MKMYRCRDCGGKTDNPSICKDSKGSGCNSTNIAKSQEWYAEQTKKWAERAVSWLEKARKHRRKLTITIMVLITIIVLFLIATSTGMIDAEIPTPFGPIRWRSELRYIPFASIAMILLILVLLALIVILPVRIKPPKKQALVLSALAVFAILVFVAMIFTANEFYEFAFDSMQITEVAPHPNHLQGASTISVRINFDQDGIGWGRQRISYSLTNRHDGSEALSGNSVYVFSNNLLNSRRINLFTYNFAPLSSYILRVYVNDNENPIEMYIFGSVRRQVILHGR